MIDWQGAGYTTKHQEDGRVDHLSWISIWSRTFKWNSDSMESEKRT